MGAAVGNPVKPSHQSNRGQQHMDEMEDYFLDYVDLIARIRY